MRPFSLCGELEAHDQQIHPLPRGYTMVPAPVAGSRWSAGEMEKEVPIGTKAYDSPPKNVTFWPFLCSVGAERQPGCAEEAVQLCRGCAENIRRLYSVLVQPSSMEVVP